MKSTLAGFLIAGLTTISIASTANAFPAGTAATMAEVAGAPTLVRSEDQPYVFIGGAKKGKPKARWNPCQPITWAVVAKGLVAEDIPRIIQAFATIASATGLKFTYKGVSKKHGETPKYHSPTIPGADIAIVFQNFERTFPKHVEASAYGGAQYWKPYASRIAHYELGYVRVDTPDLPNIPEPLREVLYLHELGLVLGLDHAPGANVMNPTLSPDILQYSAGDLAGLKLLGRQAGDCKSSSPF